MRGAGIGRDHGFEFACFLELHQPAAGPHVFAHGGGLFVTEPRLHLRNHRLACGSSSTTVSIPISLSGTEIFASRKPHSIAYSLTKNAERCRLETFMVAQPSARV